MTEHDFTSLEHRLIWILNTLSGELSARERREVEEFIEANEYGVALETLCAILVEEQKVVAPPTFAALGELADAMGIRAAVITHELRQRVELG